jgi:hypothetical protein
MHFGLREAEALLRSIVHGMARTCKYPINTLSKIITRPFLVCIKDRWSWITILIEWEGFPSPVSLSEQELRHAEKQHSECDEAWDGEPLAMMQ